MVLLKLFTLTAGNSETALSELATLRDRRLCRALRVVTSNHLFSLVSKSRSNSLLSTFLGNVILYNMVVNPV